MGQYTTRPITINECNDIFNVLLNGATFEHNGSKLRIQPNYKVYLALYTMANVGLRISDILQLTPNRIKSGQLAIVEKKTNKQQLRPIPPTVYNKLIDYILEHNISSDSLIFDTTERNIQKVLKKVCLYLGLENVSTHSFRKLFATTMYQASGSDYNLVKELLNHSSIATTQRYIGKDYSKINKYSSISIVD